MRAFAETEDTARRRVMNVVHSVDSWQFQTPYLEGRGLKEWIVLFQFSPQRVPALNQFFLVMFIPRLPDLFWVSRLGLSGSPAVSAAIDLLRFICTLAEHYSLKKNLKYNIRCRIFKLEIRDGRDAHPQEFDWFLTHNLNVEQLINCPLLTVNCQLINDLLSLCSHFNIRFLAATTSSAIAICRPSKRRH